MHRTRVESGELNCLELNRWNS